MIDTAFREMNHVIVLVYDVRFIALQYVGLPGTAACGMMSWIRSGGVAASLANPSEAAPAQAGAT